MFGPLPAERSAATAVERAWSAGPVRPVSPASASAMRPSAVCAAASSCPELWAEPSVAASAVSERSPAGAHREAMAPEAEAPADPADAELDGVVDWLAWTEGEAPRDAEGAMDAEAATVAPDVPVGEAAGVDPEHAAKTSTSTVGTPRRAIWFKVRIGRSCRARIHKGRRRTGSRLHRAVRPRVYGSGRLANEL